MSSSTASAASLACTAVSATTQATASPTNRTLPLASDGRGGVFIGEPSRCGMFIGHFNGPKPAASRSAWV
jgi:hypothetical protein